MTYNNLFKKLQKLTPLQLKNKVILFHGGSGDVYPISDLYFNNPDEDNGSIIENIKKKAPYLFD